MVNHGLVPKQEQSLSWLPGVPSLTVKPAETFQWEELALWILTVPEYAMATGKDHGQQIVFLGVQEVLTISLKEKCTPFLNSGLEYKAHLPVVSLLILLLPKQFPKAAGIIKWMDLEDIKLSEINQSQQDK